MNAFLTAVLFVVSALTCVRLLFYRRGSARYRLHVSLLAWVLIASSGSTALEVLLGRFAHGATLGHVGLAVVLCVLSFTARGNVADILRTRHE